MGRKPKLNYEEQIKKLKSLGILFNEINENQAKEILKSNTYFFKLSSFRKNIPKDNSGNYNFEFSALSDLATLDMRLRYMLLPMCLDIEHSLKTDILEKITNDDTEDGYTIMQDFIKNHQGDLNKIFSTIIKRDNTVMPSFQKYYDDPPVWVCLELMSFGQFSAFVEFYSDRTNNDELRKAGKFIKFAKNIRNKCAHSQPILLNLAPRKNLKTESELKRLGHKQGLSKVNLKVLPIIDILSLLILHSKYCSEGIKNNRKDDLITFKKRKDRKYKHYRNVPAISHFFLSLNKMIDYYIKNN
ncbi:Abi family protein [Staphylococcus sp. HMSC065A08]|uniref:Abi family protein n=1 Tax=Staphylococcus sp. HMSC065A08 TaxID=1739417 RepID=UPI0008A47462|nr:Abi family protein [Staphylococcus sp. HMSC065A08]OFQ92539.1 CAAX protease [Staphylococcus sp. HMSC065A08]